MKNILVATTTTHGQRLVNVTILKRNNFMENRCDKCIHFIPESMDDIAFCNCCEDYCFFEPIPYWERASYNEMIEGESIHLS